MEGEGCRQCSIASSNYDGIPLREASWASSHWRRCVQASQRLRKGSDYSLVTSIWMLSSKFEVYGAVEGIGRRRGSISYAFRSQERWAYGIWRNHSFPCRRGASHPMHASGSSFSSRPSTRESDMPTITQQRLWGRGHLE